MSHRNHAEQITYSEFFEHMGNNLAESLEQDYARPTLVQFCRENPRLASISQLVMIYFGLEAIKALSVALYCYFAKAQHRHISAYAMFEVSEAALAVLFAVLALAMVAGADFYQLAQNKQEEYKKKY